MSGGIMDSKAARHKKARSRRGLGTAAPILLALTVAGTVAGCAAPSMSFLPFVGEDDSDEPEVFQSTSEKYCYRTLAQVDCYRTLQPGEESRRVDWFDSPDYPR